jgi:predicted transcriptional regulator
VHVKGQLSGLSGVLVLEESNIIVASYKGRIRGPKTAWFSESLERRFRKLGQIGGGLA